LKFDGFLTFEHEFSLLVALPRLNGAAQFWILIYYR
jgi:hypothetical protein